MTPEMAAMRALALTALSALSLAGCSHEPTQADDAALLSLQARLPGHYDNAAQVRADARNGATDGHVALDLLIAPANAALIGKSVYYVRESAGGDPRRVLAQYIWVFGRTIEAHGSHGSHGGGGGGGGGSSATGSSASGGSSTGGSAGGTGKAQHLEQHIYVFKEPQRWIHGDQQPELLEALLPEDLQRLSGCELLWTQNDTGFVAVRSSTACAASMLPEGQFLEQRIELRANQLALLEQRVGPDGLSDLTELSDPYYRFARRGAAN